MSALSHNTSPLESIPTAQVVARIFAIEAWRVDLWAATPGSVVYGLPPEAVANFVGDHLDALRAELRRREGLEVGR